MAICIICIVLALVIFNTLLHYQDNKNKVNINIDISESLKKASLPVISLIIEGKKHNFMIDTGSDACFIDENAITLKKVIGHTTFHGADGVEKKAMVVSIDCEYNNICFNNVNFILSDFKSAYESIHNESGIMLSGIIGNNFMQKYKCVLDYKDNKFTI